MNLAKTFIDLHNALHWWGPEVVALYTGLAEWVMSYPFRNTEEVNYNPLSSVPDTETFNISVTFFLFASVVYYILWFALPYEGVEILLLLIVGLPFAAIYFLYTVFMWCFEGFMLLCDFDRHEWVKKGLSYAEWEIYKYKLARRENERRLRAMEEREAMFAGRDIRKDRFRIIDGGNVRGEVK
ncbi:MAG: hypothetical protein K6T83_00260 [Alicyclobacillus sp.]|nr:hypothetical protein [Alicyclobacillus sp.]